MRTPRSRWTKDLERNNRLSQILDRNPDLPGLLHEAFTQYVWDLPDASDAPTGALSKARIEGARNVIAHFLGMADQIPSKRTPIPGLKPPENE